MAKAVQSHPPSPSPKHETASSRNSIEKWYIIWGLDTDIEAFEERVAIHIHEGGIPTDQAKDLAAQAQGFRSQAHYWAWLRVYVERKRLG